MSVRYFKRYTQFEVDTCLTCGIMFAAPRKFFDARHEDGRVYYCPNGHEQYFVQDDDDTPGGEK